MAFQLTEVKTKLKVELRELQSAKLSLYALKMYI